MLVLFDNGTPRTLARFLIDQHMVTEARARGWEELENGDLLREAEAAGFRVLVTTDKNLSYQQNLKGRKIAIAVLGLDRRPVQNNIRAALDYPADMIAHETVLALSQIVSFEPWRSAASPRITHSRITIHTTVLIKRQLN